MFGRGRASAISTGRAAWQKAWKIYPRVSFAASVHQRQKWSMPTVSFTSSSVEVVAASSSTPRDRGSSNRRAGSEDTGGIRVTSGSLMTVSVTKNSAGIVAKFRPKFSLSFVSSFIPEELEFSFTFDRIENILKIVSSRWRYDLLLLLLLVFYIPPSASLFEHLLLTRLDEIILWLKIFSNGNFWFFNPVFQKSIDLLKPYFKQASHHLYILTVQNHVVMLHALMDRLFHACSSVSITPSRASYTRAYHPSFLHVAKIFSITMEQQAWVKTFKYSKNKHRVIISARKDTFSLSCENMHKKFD